jgi:sialate O-acetylesterase
MAKLETPVAGGPYLISVKAGQQQIDLNDVLIGEVWLASGQSNMEMPLKGWPPNDPIANSAVEIENANNNQIRMLTVAHNIAAEPLEEMSGNWQVATSANAGDFSATAYFFARKLNQTLGIPIGIIHSSWGGTPAEAWTSKVDLENIKGFESALASLGNPESSKNTEDWFANKSAIPRPNSLESWQAINFNDEDLAKSDFDDSKWSTITFPGRFDEMEFGEVDGVVWLRKNVVLDDISSGFTIDIAAIDDMDETYFNGTKIGGLMGEGFWNLPRKLTIPQSLLVKGQNTIAIRAIDGGGPGLINGPIQMTSQNGLKIDLSGEWKSNFIAELFGGQFYQYDSSTDIKLRPKLFQMNQNMPTVLFNGMIKPLVPYTIKGAIWYQGESNVGRAEEYRRLFPAMIENWRTEWGDDFPFYFVQIAPYIYNPNTSEQVSQELRDAQRLTLSLPKTGMAVTLDIGNINNIHPANKQDVGLRLALWALAKDYGQSIVPSGPLFKSAKPMGNTIVVEFDFAENGLKASEKELSGFEVAGDDGQFKLAKATIEGNKVVVRSAAVSKPVHVRYAWNDEGLASLFNTEGLPASSFSSFIN